MKKPPTAARRLASALGRLASEAGLLLLKAIARLPFPAVVAIGNGLGTLAWWLAAPRRRVALVNLALCFPELAEKERHRLAREHFRFFMRSVVERFIFWFGPPRRIQRLVRVENWEIMRERAGKPLIILAPHFVAIDACGMRLAMETPYVTMYARQKNPVLERAMRQGRSRFPGAVVLPRQAGMRPLLRHLRDGLPLYFLPDMDLGRRDAVFLPFFGVQAATVPSTARLAQLTGADVIFFVTEMRADGYVGRFYPPMADFPGDDPVEATLRINRFIEERVREMPAQYLWTHKRFKTRPPGERSPYRRS